MTPASNGHEDLSESDQIQVEFQLRFAEVLFGVMNTATNQMHAAGYIWCKSVNLSTLPPPSLWPPPAERQFVLNFIRS